MKAFETIQSLPHDYDVIKEDLEMSVADCVHNPTKYYDTWMKEAYTNASNKGFTILYKERPLPALS